MMVPSGTWQYLVVFLYNNDVNTSGIVTLFHFLNETFYHNYIYDNISRSLLISKKIEAIVCEILKNIEEIDFSVQYYMSSTTIYKHTEYREEKGYKD